MGEITVTFLHGCNRLSHQMMGPFLPLCLLNCRIENYQPGQGANKDSKWVRDKILLFYCQSQDITSFWSRIVAHLIVLSSHSSIYEWDFCFVIQEKTYQDLFNYFSRCMNTVYKPIFGYYKTTIVRRKI